MTLTLAIFSKDWLRAQFFLLKRDKRKLLQENAAKLDFFFQFFPMYNEVFEPLFSLNPIFEHLPNVL